MRPPGFCFVPSGARGLGVSDAPLILVSNDDGVLAPGITALREALESVAEVWTVAPATEQSAHSHALTLHRPLRAKKVGTRVYSVDGTPADSIYVALFHTHLLPRRPTLVVSGINRGFNLGSDVHYSGTVAAAREGAMRGVPALAVSQHPGGSFIDTAQHTCALVQKLLAGSLPTDQVPLLNVNFPKAAPEGMRVTQLGQRVYEDDVLVRKDPRGMEYLWIGGPGIEHHHQEGSDTEAIDAGFASITPLKLDPTLAAHMPLASLLCDAVQATTVSDKEETHD